MLNVKPILFSGPMIRALLDGRKTMTRRVLSPQNAQFGSAPKEYWQHADFSLAYVDGRPEHGQYLHVPCHVDVECKRCREMGWDGTAHRLWPKFEPGDLLWVREAIYLTDDGHEEYAVFAADQKSVEEHLARIDALPAYFPEELRAEHKRLRPSIHMPRWASRLTLEVTSVKVERLQEISQEDARAEGVATEEWDDWRENVTSIAMPEGSYIENERDLFRDLWDSLNAERGFGWDDNPWVSATSFIVHRMNIDDFLAQREAA